MSQQTSKTQTTKIPMRVMKHLQNLYSWKEFHAKIVAFPNEEKVQALEAEILAWKQKHNIPTFDKRDFIKE